MGFVTGSGRKITIVVDTAAPPGSLTLSLRRTPVLPDELRGCFPNIRARAWPYWQSGPGKFRASAAIGHGQFLDVVKDAHGYAVNTSRAATLEKARRAASMRTYGQARRLADLEEALGGHATARPESTLQERLDVILLECGLSVDERKAQIATLLGLP